MTQRASPSACLPEQLWWMRCGGARGPAAARASGGRGAARRAGRARVAGEERAAAERVLAQAARDQDLADAGEVRAVAAVRRARDGEVALVEGEALEHAGADGRQRLERLGRRAQEDGARVAAAAARAVRLVQAPGEAVHALDVAAAQDADGAGGAHQTTASAPGTTS